MITFQNSKSFKIDNLREKDKSVSTLLIPAHLCDPLKQKQKDLGKNLTGYLRFLLKSYKSLTHSGMLPPPQKIKTEFQDEGLDLKRVSFRPHNVDWIELGELALAFGKSRCWMFTFLFELDLTGFWEILYESGLINAVPTKNNLHLKVSLSLRQVSQDFARSYHVRV